MHFFLNNRTLPWFKFARNTSDMKVFIKFRLSEDVEKQVIKGLPCEYADVAEKILNLSFKEAPPYREFKNLL